MSLAPSQMKAKQMQTVNAQLEEARKRAMEANAALETARVERQAAEQKLQTEVNFKQELSTAVDMIKNAVKISTNNAEQQAQLTMELKTRLEDTLSEHNVRVKAMLDSDQERRRLDEERAEKNRKADEEKRRKAEERTLKREKHKRISLAAGVIVAVVGFVFVMIVSPNVFDAFATAASILPVIGGATRFGLLARDEGCGAISQCFSKSSSIDQTSGETAVDLDPSVKQQQEHIQMIQLSPGTDAEKVTTHVIASNHASGQVIIPIVTSSAALSLTPRHSIRNGKEIMASPSDKLAIGSPAVGLEERIFEIRCEVPGSVIEEPTIPTQQRKSTYVVSG